MPARELLTERGERYLRWLPSVLHESPEHLAIVHAVAREFDLVEERIALLREQFFVQTAVPLLKVWEFMVGVTVEPVGVLEEQRRQIVVAQLLRMVASPSGRAWVANVTQLVGPGWTYEEHVPGDPASPPENTIRIRLPFSPAASSYAQAEALVRERTQAHIDIQAFFIGGFELDRSQLDQEGFGPP